MFNVNKRWTRFLTKNFPVLWGGVLFQNHGKKSLGITGNHIYVNKFQSKTFKKKCNHFNNGVMHTLSLPC